MTSEKGQNFWDYWVETGLLDWGQITQHCLFNITDFAHYLFIFI